jgi:hypothetical protein
MKKILVLICFLTIGKIAIAQKDSLAVDEHGKYIYYKVVNSGTNTADVLYARASAFFKTAYDKNTLKLIKEGAKAMALIAEGNIMVSKSGSIAKHNDGRVVCKLTVEIKDSKYRYWLTDFVYTPYERDRYNNYVPKAGVDITLEKADNLIEKKDLDHYLDECAKFSKRVGAKLQQAMAAIPVAKKDTVAKKVISINKW